MRKPPANINGPGATTMCLSDDDTDGTASPNVSLVATSLSARNHATVVPLDPGRHGATVLSRADGDATWADADCIVIPPTVPVVAVIVTVVAVTPDLNIDALCLDRSGDRGSRQHCYG